MTTYRTPPLAVSAIVVASLCFLVSCGTTQAIDAAKRTHFYHASYSSVFRAALEYCEEEGFEIEFSGRSQGFIKTRYRVYDESDRIKLTLLIKDEGRGTTSVYATVSLQHFLSEWKEKPLIASDAEELYVKTFKGIADRLGIGK